MKNTWSHQQEKLLTCIFFHFKDKLITILVIDGQNHQNNRKYMKSYYSAKKNN